MQATLLLAHGSRDPAWRDPMDKIAARMRMLDKQHIVVCAFLELMSPNLQEAVAELIALKINSVTIVPMFLGIGKHARDDLPKLVSHLNKIYPALEICLRRSIGEEECVIDLLANLSMPHHNRSQK